MNIVELEYDSYVFYVELTDFCGNILEDTMNLNVQDVIVQDILKDTTLCAQDENELFFELVGDDQSIRYSYKLHAFYVELFYLYFGTDLNLLRIVYWLI